ncbi:hypothetical protein S7335_5603 [Synechococcus sp. PCC 7335]|uniref:hypothetical protein n=1 Tax=Synechococcus sp. (strain ATCC 29403 / PCC 7335) TaxID=91464 RepID=UPI00017ED259|nr:hypothetical protein [Synechococcus sp. PCC 7335]EDX87890.1 hypothetical protein S7335_5603 [Synechococcus sp. PCC 7335]
MSSIESNERLMIFLICVVPFAALLYCALVIGSLLSIPFVKSHSLIFGGIFALTPLVIGASLWVGPFRK